MLAYASAIIQAILTFPYGMFPNEEDETECVFWPYRQSLPKPLYQLYLDEHEGNEERPTESNDSIHGEHLDQRWDDLLANQLVIQRLSILASELWDADPESWGAWLRNRTQETIGEALLTASYFTALIHLAEDLCTDST